jgi:hypothetical protein
MPNQKYKTILGDQVVNIGSKGYEYSDTVLKDRILARTIIVRLGGASAWVAMEALLDYQWRVDRKMRHG